MSPTATNPALTNGPLNDFLGKVEAQILVPIITLLALAAFVVMIWGVVDYIRQADNPEARSIGTQHMLWGFVGLVIIFGTTAIINLITLLIQVF
jgi:TRAP-type C4-dicarboxylate transport system permease small subunit